ncbi:MAG: hypothetical protein IJW29_00220, partial [Clostridia bacterium]|nr:hypothetical protein [Clostridia bacterium]
SRFFFDHIGANEKRLRKLRRNRKRLQACKEEKVASDRCPQVGTAPKEKFRALRSARRAARPPLRELLKKLDQNLQQTDETRSFCLQSRSEKIF